MIYQTFIVAFLVSLFGSVPPGSINVTAMQMGILGKLRAAYFLILGATIIEICYALVVVNFQIFLQENLELTHHFKLVTATVLTFLGLYSLLNYRKKEMPVQKELKGRNGFMKGLLLGLFNPLAIPFWLAVTAYLQNNQWILLYGAGFWLYLGGIFLGSLVTLLLAVRLGSKFKAISNNRLLVGVIPGVTFLLLAAYNLYEWIVIVV